MVNNNTSQRIAVQGPYHVMSHTLLILKLILQFIKCTLTDKVLFIPDLQNNDIIHTDASNAPTGLVCDYTKKDDHVQVMPYGIGTSVSDDPLP